MTDLERADWAKELLLSWMQTRPGGVHQSSIAATEFHRLVRMLAFNVQEAVAAGRREGADEERYNTDALADEAYRHGAEEMRERAAREARYWTASQKVADRILALPLTPEDPPVALCCQGDVPLSECSLYPDHCTPEEPA